MNDQEKSILLAKAMEWDVGLMDETIFPTGEDISVFIDTGDGESLYDPANMALAKRAIQWGVNDVPGFSAWLLFLNRAYLILLDDDGFRQALDKLLKLAIEAGLVEVDDAE